MSTLKDKLNNKPTKSPGLRDTLQINQQPGISPQVSTDSGIPSFVPTETKKPKPVAAPGNKDKQAAETISKKKFETPKDFAEALEQISAIQSGMSPEQRKIFDEKRQKIEGIKQAAEDQFKKDRNTSRWLQVAETLGQALVQLGAGAYGLKHNVDLSGIKFNKNNWAQNIEEAERELDRKLRSADIKEKAVEREETALEKKLAADANFRKRAILQNFMAEQRAANSRILKAMDIKDKASAGNKDAQRLAMKEVDENIDKVEAKIKMLQKASAMAQGAKEGAKGASLDKVAQMMGGELGEQFRKDSKTPATIWGYELWRSMDEDEAIKVVNGYLKKEKEELKKYQQMRRDLVSGEPTKKEEQQGSGEIRRETKDGGIAIYDAKTKEFIRWEKEPSGK